MFLINASANLCSLSSDETLGFFEIWDSWLVVNVPGHLTPHQIDELMASSGTPEQFLSDLLRQCMDEQLDTAEQARTPS